MHGLKVMALNTSKNENGYQSKLYCTVYIKPDLSQRFMQVPSLLFDIQGFILPFIDSEASFGLSILSSTVKKKMFNLLTVHQENYTFNENAENAIENIMGKGENVGFQFFQ